MICPECEEKARRERLIKQKGLQSPAPTPPPTSIRQALVKRASEQTRPKIPQQHWLDQETGVAIAPLELPPARAARGPHTLSGRPSLPTVSPQRGASPPFTSQKQTSQAPENRPPQKKIRNAKSEGGKASVISAARQKRNPKPPTPPFAPTDEQIAAIEKRYQELAQPHEYDGVRGQISSELGIPKTAVKQAIRAYRERLNLPSWWELQTYHGSEEEKERIRQAYAQTLPLPPVGIHKQIAEALKLSPGVVYQAIKAIRGEMNLPQFNPPEARGLVPSSEQAQTDSLNKKQAT